jgi:hypothetical protein
MITVEFRSVSTGTCQWCRREKDEVYTVAFSDKSFSGPMCKPDLLRAIGMKLAPEKPAGAVPSAVGQHATPPVATAK